MDSLYPIFTIFFSVFFLFLPLLIVAISSIWVYKDAQKFKNAGVDISPTFWTVLNVVFLVPVFPIYIALRFLKYKKLAKDPFAKPSTFLNVLVVVGIIIILAILSFILELYINIEERKVSSKKESAVTQTMW